MAPYCIGGFVLLVVILLAYNFLVKGKRKALIRSLKSGTLQPTEGGPILVEGAATGPEARLPSTGERCAFYAVRVFSKKSLLEQRVSGSASRGPRSTTLKGFELSAISGNFTVRDGRDGREYVVDAKGMLDKLMQGIMMLSPVIGAVVRTQMRVSDPVQHAMDLSLEGKGVDNLLMLGFGQRMQEWKSKAEFSTGFGRYSDSSTNIGSVAVKSTVDSAVHQYTLGKDVPPAIMDILAQKGVIGTLAADGDEIYVVETYIPLGRKIYVVGTYAPGMITYGDTTTSLTVSYEDPETSKLI